jgi:hypothetical protein
LLIVAAGLLAFSHAYFQGINASNTQATARTIMTDVVQSIEFGTKQPGSSPDANGDNLSYCINNSLYVFKLGQQIGNSGVQHALVRDTKCPPPPFPVLPSGSLSSTQQELLGDHMRLAKFDIRTVGTTSTIHLIIAYGDSDLLIGKNGAGVTVALTDTTPKSTWQSLKELHCKSQTGSQFCAVADLQTTVQQRLAAP